MKKLLFIILIVTISHPAFSRNAFIDSLQKKQSAKKQTRWTIFDWLGTKKKVALMDYWLATNRSSTIFESSIKASRVKYDRITKITGSADVTEEFTANKGELEIFLYIFGLKGSYLDTNESDLKVWTAEGVVRLLGASNQNTNLSAFYGVRNQSEGNGGAEYENQYFGGSLTFYLFDFMGLDGSYRQYLPSDGDNGIELDGSRWDAGLFLESDFLRVFAKVFTEFQEFSNATPQTEVERNGLEIGAALYF